MVGIRSFPIGGKRPIFMGDVSFRECKTSFLNLSSVFLGVFLLIPATRVSCLVAACTWLTAVVFFSFGGQI